MANKKGFKDTGADLFFSANDATQEDKENNVAGIESESGEKIIIEDIPKNTDKGKPKGKKYAAILESIKQPEELPGSNITFYLETEIIDAVINTSRKMNVSRSRLVNKILKQVLLAEED